jgi:hypothetical protein
MTRVEEHAVRWFLAVQYGFGGIARGRVDGAMAEIGLQCAGIDALIGERVAAGMPEHVRVDLEANLAFVASAGEDGKPSPSATDPSLEMPYGLYHRSGIVWFWNEEAPWRELVLLRRTIARRDNDVHLGPSGFRRSSEFQTIYSAGQVDIGDEKLNVFMIIK